MPDCTRCGFSGHGLYFCGDGPLCRDCFANDYADARRAAEIAQIEDERDRTGWLDADEAEAAIDRLGFDSEHYERWMDEGYVEADLLVAA